MQYSNGACKKLIHRHKTYSIDERRLPARHGTKLEQYNDLLQAVPRHEESEQHPRRQRTSVPAQPLNQKLAIDSEEQQYPHATQSRNDRTKHQCRRWSNL
jgi:hypothetical protein